MSPELLDQLRDTLLVLWEYMDQKADVDEDTPNAEMVLLCKIERLNERIEREAK